MINKNAEYFCELPEVRDISVESVASNDLFTAGIDDVMLEGFIYKFKPGLSSNFLKRYI